MEVPNNAPRVAHADTHPARGIMLSVVTLDFETYFDKDYSLSKMSVEAYVRDARFEPHGFAIDWQNYPDAKCTDALWYDGTRAEMRNYLFQIDWDKTALLCHHAHFDGLILSHHFGIMPRAYLCTLSMARLMLGNHVPVALDSIRAHFGLAPKSTPYNLFKGKHWDELTNAERMLVANGARDEAKSISFIFKKLMRGEC